MAAGADSVSAERRLNRLKIFAQALAYREIAICEAVSSDI